MTVTATEEEVDHSRGLCGKPDCGTENIPLEYAQMNPPKCLCCGSTMRVTNSLSLGFQRLGAYEVTCTGSC